MSVGDGTTGGGKCTPDRWPCVQNFGGSTVALLSNCSRDHGAEGLRGLMGSTGRRHRRLLERLMDLWSILSVYCVLRPQIDHI